MQGIEASSKKGVNKLNTTEMLESGKARLEGAYLGKGKYVSYAPFRSYCTMGAVLGDLVDFIPDMKHPTREIEQMPALGLLREVIREQFPERVSRGELPVFDTIALFNDHDDTTKEDVIMVLEKAIIKAQELV